MIADMDRQWWDPVGPEVARQQAAQVNRELWAIVNDQYTDTQAEAKWGADDMRWGIFDIPDEELGALGDVAGLDIVELGCGTAFVSAILARAGGRPSGWTCPSSNWRRPGAARNCSARIPAAERRCHRRPAGRCELRPGDREYGASLWCDATGWVGEAARLLRPGGRLVFLTSSPLVTMCVPEAEGLATRELQRGQREIDPVRWPGGGVEFHPGHGEWIGVLRHHGFEVLALRELYAPPGATAHEYYQIADPQWARQWPAEDLWVARLA